MKADMDLRTGLREVIAGTEPPSERLGRVCALLLEGMPACDWAGYYVVDPSEPGMLVLGPFAGEPTEHVRIRFGEGVCGQAAAALRTFIIDDVSAEPNYLSCSPAVRSEIVVPVFHEGRLIGELDLDSHQVSGFSTGDSAMLGWLAEQTAGTLAELAALLRGDGCS
jgi:GAF domain-containing protein